MTFKTKYGTYEDCQFNTGYYNNGNRALSVTSATEGPICICSVNPEKEVPDDCLAVKNYSENAGMADTLIEMGVIGEKVDEIPSVYVTIPVYKLTEKGLGLWEERK